MLFHPHNLFLFLKVHLPFSLYLDTFCIELLNDVGVKTINKFNPIPYSTLKNSYFVVYRRGLGNI